MSTSQRQRLQLFLLFALPIAFSTLAYFPCLDNGFISDDYVILERSGHAAEDPGSLFSAPPEGFRTTTYLAFADLKTLFSPTARPFYVFAILLHALNAILLGWLVRLVSGRADIGLIAACFFSVIQNPCESVMWLSAINESLLGAFLLASLIFWIRERFLLAGLSCVMAWLSKESAVMIVPLALALDLTLAGRRPRFVKYLYLLVPSVFFLVVAWTTSASNPLVSHGFYAFTWRSAPVLLNSVHRLFFPWVYVFALVAVVVLRRSFPIRPVAALLLLCVIALLPSAFLTYQNHIPSRNLHVAALGVSALLAWLLEALRSRKTLAAFLGVAFVVGNVGYLWLVKDRQFEERSRPTKQLLAVLAHESPRRISLRGYPENPWIAKLAARLAPGWSPEDIVVEGIDGACEGCDILTWDPQRREFIQQGPLSR
jgi:hypothetical protein